MNPKRFFLTWLAAVVLISIAGAGVAMATPSSGVTSHHLRGRGVR